MTGEAAPKSFFDEVKASVTRFVQSAVVIDDEAYIVDGDQERLNPVTRARSPEIDFMDTPAMASPLSESKELEKIALQSADHIEDHTLNAKRMITAFAEHGIICGVINPDRGDDFVPRTFELVKKADFIVLDYKIHKSSDATFRFLQKVATEDVASNRQRAMIIYTGEDGIEEIANEVRQKLEGLELDQPVVPVGRRTTALRIGSLVIDVVRKPKREEDEFVELQGGRLDESVVPDHLIGLYAELANGLLQAAVLEDLAIIREQMPRLANLFSPDMDAAYLAHRALVDVHEAPEVVFSSIASAIGTLLQQHDSQEKLSSEIVAKWIREKLPATVSVKLGDAEQLDLNHEAIISIVEKGLANTEMFVTGKQNQPLGVSKKEKLVPRVAEIFTTDPEQALISNAKFAMATSLSQVKNSHFIFEKTNPPFLTLGCLIKNELGSDETQYLLCIQPLCDSVRISGDSRFPFIPLEVISPIPDGGAKPIFQLIVPDNEGQPIFLKIDFSPSAIRTLTFQAGEELKVVSRLDEESKIVFFTSTDNGAETHWQWVAQLRPAHAQRIVHELSTTLSRVGLDEPDWLRQGGESKWKVNKKRI